MNPLHPFEEEFPEESSSSYLLPPQPMECLNEIGPPAFLTKTFDMVDDPNTNHLVYWSIAGNSFVVWDPQIFSTNLLPSYFKHNNFSSFIRQLNTYGFRKVDPDKWEFANEGFLRGQKHLLKNIRRKKALSQPNPQEQALEPCLEVGRLGFDAEIGRLRRDKQVLTMELVKLRQQQQNTRAYLRAMEQRLQGTEVKQQQMMSFLARAISNPAFIQQLAQQKESRKEVEEAITNKRRRSIDVRARNVVKVGQSSQSCGKEQNPIKAEPEDFRDIFGFQMSELDTLAMQMQGLRKARMKEKEEEEEQKPVLEDEVGKLLDEEFWEELLNEGLGEEEEEVNVLAVVPLLEF